MLPADLQALAAFHRRVVPVHIVELNLHHLHLWVLGKNPIENLRFVVKGNAQMADLALRLQLQGNLISAAVLVVLEILRALGMHQVKIKIRHSAGGQLAFKERADILFLMEIVAGELVGQHIPVSGVAAGQALP